MAATDRSFESSKVGSRLRQERERRGISLRELARRVGVSPSLVSQIELDRVNPSVSTLYALVTELGMTMSDVFGDTPPPAPRVVRELDGGDDGLLTRPGRRRVINLESGVRWERLTPHSDPDMEFLYVTYPVGAESCPPGALGTHGGRGYGYGTGGTVGVPGWVDGAPRAEHGGGAPLEPLVADDRRADLHLGCEVEACDGRHHRADDEGDQDRAAGRHAEPAGGRRIEPDGAQRQARARAVQPEVGEEREHDDPDECVRDEPDAGRQCARHVGVDRTGRERAQEERCSFEDAERAEGGDDRGETEHADEERVEDPRRETDADDRESTRNERDPRHARGERERRGDDAHRHERGHGDVESADEERARLSERDESERHRLEQEAVEVQLAEECRVLHLRVRAERDDEGRHEREGQPSAPHAGLASAATLRRAPTSASALLRPPS